MSTLDVIERLDRWLDEPLLAQSEFGAPIQTTKGARFAELVAVNHGRTAVGGWGVISGGGLYGREGLCEGEAVELLQITAFMKGVFFIVPEAKAFIDRKLEACWTAQAALEAQEDGEGPSAALKQPSAEPESQQG